MRGARVLAPVFEREHGSKGRLSLQTNPANYQSSHAMVDQALAFDALAPNMQVKFPATAAGIVGNGTGHRSGGKRQRHRLLHGPPGDRRR